MSQTKNSNSLISSFKDLETNASIELSQKDSRTVLLGIAIAKDSRTYWSANYRHWANLFRDVFPPEASTNAKKGCSFTWEDAKEAGTADLLMGFGTAVGGSVAWMLHLVTRAAATGATVTASIATSIYNAGMQYYRSCQQ